jgi:hypothetical protein
MSADLIVRLVFWLWFSAAAAAGHFLLLQRVPPVAMPGVILALTAVLLGAYFLIRPLRGWLDGLDLRTLVLVHATRFVGIYLLTLYQSGVFPRAFVVPGSISDIVIATIALIVALVPLESGPRRRAIVIWNVVGFVALMMVLISITRLNLADPSALRSLTRLPLSFLPTMLMPLLLATHVIIFVRTARPETERAE